MMLRKIFVSALFLATVACTTVPITGRRQLSLVSSEQINAMSAQAYRQVMDTSRVLNDNNAATVKRVGGRIRLAVEQYLSQNNASQQLQGFAWEYNLIQNKQINAWCMPGGKVAVYTGILPITQNETGLAVVMGHEIAHAIAKHGEERMSQAMAAQTGGGLIGAALGGGSAGGNVFGSIFGIGSQLGMLKHGRSQESEADHLGLIFMAMAGYDPQQSVPFWERMAAQKSGGGGTPGFLSSHPSDATRIADLKRLMPEAMKYYKR